MPVQPMSGPDPSKNLSTTAGVLREAPDEAKFEVDLAELASRFAAQSGGGLSPELSADLALEIVLNEIVEQACLATGATGAAIVLERDGEMLCRASSGPTAPELGSRIDTSAGLSGECFKTQRTQWCDDTRSDPRADFEASERLAVRSVVVMPLLRNSKLFGVFELFSARPYAFGVRDERTLEVLADRTLKNLDHATRPLELQAAAQKPMTVSDELATEAQSIPNEGSESEEQGGEEGEWIQRTPALQLIEREYSNLPADVAEFPRPEHQEKAKRRFDTAAWAFGVAALACAVLLGVVMGRRWGAEQSLGSRPPATAYAAESKPPESTPTRAATVSNKAPLTKASPAVPASPRVPPGGLLVLESGKEIFRMPPNQNTETTSDNTGAVQRASSVEPDTVSAAGSANTTPRLMESRVLRRVEPQYPEAAREQNVQGVVVLEVHMGTDGGVQDVQVVSGPRLLTQAAIDAVKQWKFKPQVVNGIPVEMQTRITLNFRLPQ